MKSSPIAIVLAAGKGKRMASDLPKVLLPVCDRPMIHYVLAAVREVGIRRIVVVVGYRSELVRAELADEPDVTFVEQAQQLGTGHAAMMCEPQLAGHAGPVLILAGDSPLVQASSLRALLKEFEREHPGCLLGTATKADPTGLGRILRSAKGEFLGIVEQRDATPEQAAILEVNMSTYVFDAAALLAALRSLTADNAQREYYLTDCPGILKAAGKKVLALDALQPCEALSINTPAELAIVEAEMKRMQQCNEGEPAVRR